MTIPDLNPLGYTGLKQRTPPNRGKYLKRIPLCLISLICGMATIPIANGCTSSISITDGCTPVSDNNKPIKLETVIPPAPELPTVTVEVPDEKPI